MDEYWCEKESARGIILLSEVRRMGMPRGASPLESASRGAGPVRGA